VLFLIVTNKQNSTKTNCYAADGLWSDSSANASLIGTPSGNNIIGTIWSSTVSNQPYELVSFGYTPYTIINITTTPLPSLVQTFISSIFKGDTTAPGIINDKSYTILQKSGGDPSSYDTITINSNTGAISCTSNTSEGIYVLNIRNTGSYNITSYVLVIKHNEIPNVPICFPAGTPVLTDQGEIPIDKINTSLHTINKNKIVAITSSIPLDNYLICIERNSLGYNVPNKKTIISKDHKIMCDNKMLRAEYLIQYIPGIYKISYNKHPLYNVLLKDHSTMIVNNLTVETMDPKNILAKLYTENYTPEQKNNMIKHINKYNIDMKKKGAITKNIFKA
jgi:hypothetical protein